MSVQTVLLLHAGVSFAGLAFLVVVHLMKEGA